MSWIRNTGKKASAVIVFFRIRGLRISNTDGEDGQWTYYLQDADEGWKVARGIRIRPAMAINLTQLEPGTCSDAATSEKQPFDYFIMTCCTTSENTIHMKTCLKVLSSETDPAEIRLIVKRMGGGQNSLKNLRAPPFDKDLSNETTFSLIHLAGQYL